MADLKSLSVPFYQFRNALVFCVLADPVQSELHVFPFRRRGGRGGGGRRRGSGGHAAAHFGVLWCVVIDNWF